MGKQTIIPIKGKGYVLTEGTLSSFAKGERRTVTLDKKIIAVLIRFTPDTGQMGDMFYYNPNLSFWETGDLTLLNTIVSPFKGYVYNSAVAVTATWISDYSFQLYNPASKLSSVKYIAILEDDSVVGAPIFLLSNTTIYTDGTPTTDIVGAIRTIETNKYKMKANALVTITGATYLYISN